MPMTDLVTHYIPTYPDMPPKSGRLRLYTEEELQWQKENIPKLLNAGVILRCESPWMAPTKFPRKKSGVLRMVHTYNALNNATIKSHYPLRRPEPLINDMSKRKLVYKFQADGTNGY